MQKINLIERADRWAKNAEKGPRYGYPRGNPQIAKVSAAIIKTICEQENITPFIAKYALEMAADIITAETQHDAIL